MPWTETAQLFLGRALRVIVASVAGPFVQRRPAIMPDPSRIILSVLAESHVHRGDYARSARDSGEIERLRYTLERHASGYLNIEEAGSLRLPLKDPSVRRQRRERRTPERGPT